MTFEKRGCKFGFVTRLNLEKYAWKLSAFELYHSDITPTCLKSSALSQSQVVHEQLLPNPSLSDETSLKLSLLACLRTQNCSRFKNSYPIVTVELYSLKYLTFNPVVSPLKTVQVCMSTDSTELAISLHLLCTKKLAHQPTLIKAASHAHFWWTFSWNLAEWNDVVMTQPVIPCDRSCQFLWPVNSVGVLAVACDLQCTVLQHPW